MLRNQLRQEAAVHASGHVVARRYGEERPGVVVKNRRCYRNPPSRLFVAGSAACPPGYRETTRWTEQQGRVVAGQGCQFPGIGGFVQCEQDQAEIGIISTRSSRVSGGARNFQAVECPRRDRARKAENNDGL